MASEFKVAGKSAPQHRARRHSLPSRNRIPIAPFQASSISSPDQFRPCAIGAAARSKHARFGFCVGCDVIGQAAGKRAHDRQPFHPSSLPRIACGGSSGATPRRDNLCGTIEVAAAGLTARPGLKWLRSD